MPDPVKPIAKKVSVTKLKALANPIDAMPDTLITPKGNILTKQQFLESAKNGLAFNDMKTMGDWIDGWSHKTNQPINIPPTVVAPQKQVIQPSDKLAGLSNGYYPANNQAVSPSPATILPSSRY